MKIDVTEIGERLHEHRQVIGAQSQALRRMAGETDEKLMRAELIAIAETWERSIAAVDQAMYRAQDLAGLLDQDRDQRVLATLGPADSAGATGTDG